MELLNCENKDVEINTKLHIQIDCTKYQFNQLQNLR